MLQQTQVSRVVPKFLAFIERFPTVESLARAPEKDVLAAWTGLGYYRRAKNLHAAARAVVERFAGRVPSTVADLRSLPGVGPYTAGAIASIAFGQPEPIVDGNVARVLIRVHGREAHTADPTIQPWLWSVARDLVTSATSPGALNEGLMELGATVCVPPPAAPACMLCPLRNTCVAHQQGRELEIPLPKPRAKRAVIHCAAALVVRADGAILLEQRPATGMWANMWQTPTLESQSGAKPPTRTALASALKLAPTQLSKLETFDFFATHRELRFTVYGARVPSTYRPPAPRTFVAPTDLPAHALSSPQRRILDLAAESLSAPQTASSRSTTPRRPPKARRTQA